MCPCAAYVRVCRGAAWKDEVMPEGNRHKCKVGVMMCFASEKNSSQALSQV